MENKKYNVKNVYVAELKYYDKEHDGVEFGEELSLVVLSSFKKGNQTIFYNVLNEGEVLPTFGRSTKYGEYDSFGNQYGTKMHHLGGKLESGPCWVLRHDLSGFDYKEEISKKEIEDAILESEHYFKDRKMIAEQRCREKNHPFKMIKIIRKDSVAEDYMNYFFTEREEQRQKAKK